MILYTLLIRRESNVILSLILRITYKRRVFTQALIAVAKAMPTSNIDCISISDKIIFTKTLKIEIYSGVLVSSLAKKQVTNTFINI